MESQHTQTPPLNTREVRAGLAAVRKLYAETRACVPPRSLSMSAMIEVDGRAVPLEEFCLMVSVRRTAPASSASSSLPSTK